VAKDPYKYFRIEARELLDGLQQGLLEIERGSSDPDLVAKLLRFAHSLKGSSRVVKLTGIGERAHALEEALAPFRQGSRPMPQEQAGALLRLLDEIGERLGAIDAPADAAPTAQGLARTTAVEPLDTVRIEVRAMDDLLDGITEATVQVSALQRDGVALQQVQRLAGILVDQLSVGGMGVASVAAEGGGRAKAFRLAEELKRSLDVVQRSVSRGAANVSAELAQIGEAANGLRLLPASSLFAPLDRVSRDAAQSLGKAVVFHASGGDTRLDAQVLIELRPALVQLVRNAVAHGIETPGERVAAGKPTAGRVDLTVERRADKVAVRCRDDGRGIDVEALRRSLVAQGLLPSSEARSLDLAGIFQILLRGGVTTTRTVTEVSGRGVGLDVVREAAARLNGEIAVRSEAGRGTDIEVCVPVSLTSLAVLQVEVAGVVVSLPLEHVWQTVRIARADVVRSGDGDSILFEGQVIPLLPLAKALRRQTAPTTKPFHPAVVVRSGEAAAAVGVDRLLGLANVVVRSLPTEVEADAIISGASLDAEGNPQLVLDAGGLLQAARAGAGGRAHAELVAERPVLVVDDSLTTRMLEQSILESAGYEVHVAASAEEALGKATERPYGIFIVDVEMPGMDGFEFVTRTRADPVLRSVPAILLTSRESVDDKRRGREAGASAYIVKGEFDQAVLLQTIRNLVG
jgi:two-component system chemotaxis sensor kinase CheA